MSLRASLPLLRTAATAGSRTAAFSRCAPAFSEITIKDKLKAGKALSSSEIAGVKPLPGLITVEGEVDVAMTSGMPDEERKERLVRIYKPAKNAMQSGTAGIKRWKIEFDNQARWENNLMGWTSSGDPLSNMLLDFSTKEDAIFFADKHGWAYELEDPKERAPKVKSYAFNFSWNKRTRKSTK